MAAVNKSVTLFDNLMITISAEDWDFMCKNRFGTDTPSIEDWQMEFVSGTGITSNKKEKWAQANQDFAEYISDLRRIQSLNINEAARFLSENEKEEKVTCV